MTTQLFTAALEVIECDSCGTRYGLDPAFVRERRKSHKTFWCPNGCARHYPGQTEEERLRDELARATHREEQARAAATWERERREAADRRSAAAKGQVTKLKRRARAGVCLECNRTFPALADHMAQKHGGRHGRKGPR